jgi:hypothetical protein
LAVRKRFNNKGGLDAFRLYYFTAQASGKPFPRTTGTIDMNSFLPAEPVSEGDDSTVEVMYHAAGVNQCKNKVR